MTIREAFHDRITHAKINNKEEAERVLCELLDYLDCKGLLNEPADTGLDLVNEK